MFLVREYPEYYDQTFWDTSLIERRNVPKQSSSGAVEAQAAASEAGSVGLQVLTLVNVGLAACMQMSLDELWVVINTLSFVVYLPLFSFNFPDNCQLLMQAFLSVVTFDIIETLQMFNIDIMPFEFIETPPFNENFEELGYENSNTVALMGTVNIAIFAMLVIFTLALLVKIISPIRKSKFGRKVSQKFPFKSQLGTLNQLVITGSMELLVCTVVNIVPSQTEEDSLLQMEWSELPKSDKFALAYGIGCLGIFCFMIVLYIVLIVCLSPKVAFVNQQKELEVFFKTKIDAYKAALKEIKEKQKEEEKRQRQEAEKLRRE